MGPVKGLALIAVPEHRCRGKADYAGRALCRPPAGKTDMFWKGTLQGMSVME